MNLTEEQKTLLCELIDGYAYPRFLSSCDPVRIDKNKKVLDQVWDIAQNYKIVEEDNERYLATIQIWSKLSTRFKKL